MRRRVEYYNVECKTRLKWWVKSLTVICLTLCMYVCVIMQGESVGTVQEFSSGNDESAVETSTQFDDFDFAEDSDGVAVSDVSLNSFKGMLTSAMWDNIKKNVPESVAELISEDDTDLKNSLLKLSKVIDFSGNLSNEDVAMLEAVIINANLENADDGKIVELEGILQGALYILQQYQNQFSSSAAELASFNSYGEVINSDNLKIHTSTKVVFYGLNFSMRYPVVEFNGNLLMSIKDIKSLLQKKGMDVLEMKMNSWVTYVQTDKLLEIQNGSNIAYVDDKSIVLPTQVIYDKENQNAFVSIEILSKAFDFGYAFFKESMMCAVW